MRHRLLGYAAAVLAACAGQARAETPSDDFWFQLEGFRPEIESTARVDFPSTRVPGTEVSFEDELGLSDRKTLPYVLAGMRLGERWRIEMEYYELKRSGTRTIERDIHWDDIVFPASGTVSSKFDSSIFRISGGYSFHRSATAEFGGSFGLHITDFELAASGQGDGPAGVGFQSDQTDQLVPLPTIGLYGSYMLSPQWMLRARVDYLSLHYDEYEGSLVNLMASVGWRFSKHFGVGIGYRYVDYEVKVSKPRFRGEVNYKFRGPSIFLEAAL